MSVLTVNNENFESEVLNSDKVVLVEFGAAWCGPCKKQYPLLEELANTSKVKVVTIDVDEAAEVADKFNVRNVPTLIVFKNGKKVDQKIGLTTFAGLNLLVDSHIE